MKSIDKRTAGGELMVRAFGHFREGSTTFPKWSNMGPVLDQLQGDVDGGSLTESIFISVIGKNFEKNSKEHCSSLIFFQTWFYHFEQIRM